MSSTELKCYSQKCWEWRYHRFKCECAQLLWGAHTTGYSVSVHNSCEHYALQVAVWVCTAPVSGTHCRFHDWLRFLSLACRGTEHHQWGDRDSTESELRSQCPVQGEVLHYSGIVKGENRASFRIFLPKRNMNKMHELAHMKLPWKQDCLLLQLFQWASFSFAESLLIHKWTLHFASGTEVSLGFQTHTFRGQNPGQWFSDLRWKNSHGFNQLPTSVSTSKPC